MLQTWQKPKLKLLETLHGFSKAARLDLSPKEPSVPTLLELGLNPTELYHLTLKMCCLKCYGNDQKIMISAPA